MRHYRTNDPGNGFNVALLALVLAVLRKQDITKDVLKICWYEDLINRSIRLDDLLLQVEEIVFTGA